MKKTIEAFLTALDLALAPHAKGEKLVLYHIGRSSLVYKYDYPAATNDIDILRPRGTPHLLQFALNAFGRNSAGAKQLGLYLEVVEEGLPPVPAGYEARAEKLGGAWENISVYHLSPHDLAATKLRRYSTKDREDIQILCDLGLLECEQLEFVLEKAFLWNLEKDGDPFRDTAFHNLREVQRYLRGEKREL